jgi:hypothetical protein
MADRSTKTSPVPASFAGLAGLTSLAIMFQALSAGAFESGHGGWLNAHHAVGVVTAVFAVLTAVFGIARLRKVAPKLVRGSVALAVVAVVQVGLGHAVTHGHSSLLILHIPLALSLFGLTVWLSISSRALRRTA